jgi:NAD(P)-binding Rossmann-like domain
VAASPSMRPTPLHVLIVGGGVGGLCLAQGLRRAGVSVAVYERDRSPGSRLEGFRLHINPAGARALRACLPPALWGTFIASAGRGRATSPSSPSGCGRWWWSTRTSSTGRPPTRPSATTPPTGHAAPRAADRAGRDRPLRQAARALRARPGRPRHRRLRRRYLRDRRPAGRRRRRRPSSPNATRTRPCSRRSPPRRRCRPGQARMSPCSATRSTPCRRPAGWAGTPRCATRTSGVLPALPGGTAAQAGHLRRRLGHPRPPSPLGAPAGQPPPPGAVGGDSDAGLSRRGTRW